MTKSLTIFLLFVLPLFSFSQYQYIENPTLFQENKEVSHAFFIFDTQEEVRDIAGNSNYLLLNGNWKFSHANTPEERVKEFYKEDYDVNSWVEIPVPSDWQMYGYDYPIYTNWKYPFKADKPNVPRDFNPVGSYKRNFTLPEDWQATKDEFILHLGGVNSCFFVWINGQYLGYSEDSKLPSEFKVSPLLHNGENQIAVEVYKYCDGTYLEDQDMWRLSGIERDIFLYKKPQVSLADITITASLDESYVKGLFTVDLKLDPSKKPQQGFQISCLLLDRNGTKVFQRFEAISPIVDTCTETSYKGEITSVKTWSDDAPYLYSLEIKLLDNEHNLIQKVTQKVGFKKLEIKEGVFYINGDTALIKGVNRHEHDPNWGHATGYTGNVFSLTDMRKDLELIKSLNFNAIRTAHYPNHPAFYDLCDELGIYVCDEANVEAHWYMMFKPFNNITRDEDYQEAILSRIYNMYQRDKNHPSIIMWSVGNENGTGLTMVESYKMLKELDLERPVFNERHFFLNAIGEKHSDFNGNMYAPIEKVQKIIDKDHDKPFIWIEYAHAMGNSSGNFKDLWDFVRSEPQVQGGFIWDWRDQGIWKTNENGDRFLGYGGHFEPQGEGNIGGLQGDGNFCANGVISADGKLHPGAYEIAYVQQGDYRSSKDDANFELPFFADLAQFSEGLNYKLSSDGFIVLGIRKSFDPRPIDNGEFYLTNSSWSEKQFSIQFDQTGRLSSYVLEGDTVITEFGLNFWRAPTDNDFGNGMPKRCADWRGVSFDQVFSGMNILTRTVDSVVVQTHFTLPKNESGVITYTIYKSGELKFDIELNLSGKAEIPRIGSYFKLSKNQAELIYYGFGPHENYIDRLSSATTGEYEMTVFEQACPYIRPQEYGNRTNILAVRTLLLEFSGEEKFSFSAWNHSLWDLEEYPEKQGKTILDIPKRDYIWLNIDHTQMGVGGDNSWGRKPYDQYLLKAGQYSYTYTISPR